MQATVADPGELSKYYFHSSAASLKLEFFLTKGLPHRIYCLMRNVINIVLLLVFLISGVSGLPACYATKLDCEKKNTLSCPFGNETAAVDSKEFPPCHFQTQDAKELPNETGFPLERYKRLTIEQIPYNPIELPPFILSLAITLIPSTLDTNTAQEQIAGETRNPYYHPPPLFIQYQSFLI